MSNNSNEMLDISVFLSRNYKLNKEEYRLRIHLNIEISNSYIYKNRKQEGIYFGGESINIKTTKNTKRLSLHDL